MPVSDVKRQFTSAELNKCCDEEIIALVGEFVSGGTECTISDLKGMLAQATIRKLDGSYVAALTALIQDKIQSGGTKEPVSGEFHRKAAQKEEVSETVAASAPASPVSEETEYEEFPVLGFLSVFYKVLAWLLFVVCLAAGTILGIVYLSGKTEYVVACVLGGITLGTLFLLWLYTCKIEYPAFFIACDRCVETFPAPINTTFL